MKEVLKQLLTGGDNQTHDIGRWMAAIIGASGVVFQGWAVIHNGQPFNMQDFGIGAGALATGVGAMLKLKQDTEPSA